MKSITLNNGYLAMKKGVNMRYLVTVLLLILIVSFGFIVSRSFITTKQVLLLAQR